MIQVPFIIGNSGGCTETHSVTIAAADWNATTKVATVTADWAVQGMSAAVTPNTDYLDLFKSLAVQGVYCVGILNGYLQFRNGTETVMTDSIVMNIEAINDEQGNIVNAEIISPSINGYGIGADSDYIVTVADNKATVTGVAPYVKWEVPPYDSDGNPITAAGGTAAFTNGNEIDEIVFGNNVKSISPYACNANTNLKKVKIGKNVTSINSPANIYAASFSNCTNLISLEFEDNRTELLIIPQVANKAAFQNCTALVSIRIPDLICIPNYSFLTCTALKTVRYESSYGLEGTFAGCTALEELTFTQATPVSISSPTSIFNSAQYIFVPYDSLTAYTTATNWVSYAYYMYGIGKFTAGIMLPAQTTDGNWNLTWYATKVDLKAGTNPIMTAPSEFDNEYGEIYCTKTAVA